MIVQFLICCILFFVSDILALKMNIWRTMESDPTFVHNDAKVDLRMHRQMTFLKVKRLLELNFVSFEEAMTDPAKSMAWVGAVGMQHHGQISSFLANSMYAPFF